MRLCFVFKKGGGTPANNISGAACANLARTFHDLPPTDFSNAAVDGNTRSTRWQGIS